MAHNTKFAKYCLDDNNLYSVDGSGTSRERGRADVRKENELYLMWSKSTDLKFSLGMEEGWHH